MCICCYFSHFKQLHQRLSVPSSCGQVSIQIIESCGSAVGQNLFHLGTRRRAVAFQVLTAEQTPGIQFHYTWTGRPLSLFFFFFLKEENAREQNAARTHVRPRKGYRRSRHQFILWIKLVGESPWGERQITPRDQISKILHCTSSDSVC